MLVVKAESAARVAATVAGTTSLTDIASRLGALEERLPRRAAKPTKMIK